MEHESFELVTAEQLEELGDQAPQAIDRGGQQSGGQFDIAGWMAEHFPEAVEKPWREGMLWQLPECPFNPEHRGTARVVQLGSGALSFGCFHNSCQGKEWHYLRDLKEPGWRAEKKGKKKDSDDIPKPIATSFYVKGSVLFEQICQEGRSVFLRYDSETGHEEVVSYIEQGDERIVPIESEELQLGAIKLPSGTMEYGSSLELLADIEAHIEKYVDVTGPVKKFAAYYILFTWIYDRFNTLPYLRFLGDTGCGKSRALDVCGGLCYKPIPASGCITPAPIYRLIRRWGGTIILDEADLKNSDELNEVVTILNCGFERGRPVIRSTKDNPDNLQFLPTFGPKLFATRQRFKDPALEARCLTEIMQETARTDIPAVLNATFHREQEELRNKLLLFRLRNFAIIDAEQVVELKLDIEPRLKQISNVFTVLFADQPEILEDYSEFIKVHQRELIEQRLASPTGQVVQALLEQVDKTEIITAIVGGNRLELLPISSGDLAQNIGMTPQVVGGILATLGLQSKVVKVEGKAKKCLIYDDMKLETLRKRYSYPENETAVTTVTTVTAVKGDDGDNEVPVLNEPPATDHSVEALEAHVLDCSNQ